MIKAIYDLDMTPMRTLPIIINVSQYDDLGRTLVFNLFSSSGKWTAPTSAAVTFEGGKPDGKFFAYNCAYSSGTVTVTIQQQMTAVAGKVRCKIKVKSGDKVVESAPIIMVVDAAAVPDGSDMSKSDINDAIANATQKIVDQVKDSIPSDYAQLSTDVNSLKQDYSYFKNTTGYVLKPLYSIHKESISQGTFLNLGNAEMGHRYTFVYTPLFNNGVSIGVMDENSNLHDVIDGQTYYSTITASVNGRIMFIAQSNIDYRVDILVYDTTNNDVIQDFIKKSLLLATELKFNYHGRQKITIKSSDDEALNVVRLTGACNIGNVDVYFEDSTYVFSAWYNYVYYMNNNNAFRCEIPIGNGCNYYFNGATINGVVRDNILASPTIKTNCALFGSRTNEGDYKLINGVISATGTIYTVHDEMSGKSKYNHGYENMIINYISGTQKETIRKCIGGGAGRYGNVVLKNCVLDSDYSHELAFHGYANVLGNVDGKITLNISDCYFGHGIQVDTLPNKEIGTVITVCNSFRSDYADYENKNWTKYSWNNETRQN